MMGLARSDRPSIPPHALALVGAVLLLLLASVVRPAPALAQEWDTQPARALAERATMRRSEQLADTALRDYRAVARGFLTFLAQVGEGFPDPPRVVKADELAVEVYWAAPNRSRQVIVGRRDTLLLPGDIQYYQDRFGIIQNNFADRIRLGDGNDVADVPHPLSTAGLQAYHFALGDSITIRVGGEAIRVVEVKFRPRDESAPRAVGTLYVDRANAAVARMALTFTSAAILDRRIETLAVTLENGLVDGRFWLPRRQELEVGRTGTWLDFPARGIIRGRWEVDDYEVNQGFTQAFFAGPEITRLSLEELRRYDFGGPILEALPDDVREVTDADVARVREQAEALVRQRALARASGAALSARRVSDFIRVNRVEGLALGAGGVWRPAPGYALTLRGRYGLDDERVKGRLSLSRRHPAPGGVELFVERAYREAGDAQESSLVLNSLAAQEFGSDYTDPYDVRAAGLGVTMGDWLGLRWRAEGAWESQRPLAVHAAPSHGAYEPTLLAADVEGARLSLFADRALAAGPLGTELRWSAELQGGLFDDGVGDEGGGDLRYARLTLRADAERLLARGRLVLATTAVGVAGGDGERLPQTWAYFGGPTTGPGYDFHTLAGRAALSQRVEWRRGVPFPAIPLGRFGRAPARMTLAPYLHAVALDGRTFALPGRPERAAGVYPAVGVGGLFLFDLIRLDVARGLRDGRWMFGVDVTRTLWGIL